MSVFDLLNRPIAFHRVFVQLTGSVKGAVMLSQACYWQPRSKQQDGFWYKTSEEWEEETGLSRHEQKKARKDCEKYLMVELRGIPATNFYRVDEDALLADLLAVIQPSSLPKSGKLVRRFSENYYRNTETTTETTHTKGKKMKTSKGTDDVAYELWKALKNSGANVTKNHLRVMREILTDLDEGNDDMRNRQWNMVHGFPTELEPVIQKLEKGLGVSNMMRDENAIEVYRWVAEQKNLSKFIEWATMPERVQFIGKYKKNPGLIKVEWKAAMESIAPRTTASEVRF